MATSSSTVTCASSSTLQTNVAYLALPLGSSSCSPPPFSSLSSPSSLQSPSPSTSSPPSSTSFLKPSQAHPLPPSTSPVGTNAKKRSAASAFGLDSFDGGLDSGIDTFDWEDDDYDQQPFHQRLNLFSPFRPFAASRIPRHYSIMRNLRGGYDCDDDDQSALGLYAPYDGTSYVPLGQPQQPQPQFQFDQQGLPTQASQQQLTPQLSQSQEGYPPASQAGQSLERMEPVQQSLLPDVSSGVGDEEGVALLSAAAAGLVPLPTTPFRQSTLSPQSPSLHTPSMLNFDMQMAPLAPSPMQTPPLTPFMAPFVTHPSGAMMPPPPPIEETRDLLALIRPTPMPHLPMPRGFCLSTIQEGDVSKLVQMVSSIPRPAGRKLIAKLLANSAPSFPSSTVSSYPSSAASLASLASHPSSNSSYSPSPFPETDEQTLRASIQARVGQQTAAPGQPGQPGWRYNVIRRSSNFNDIVGLVILEPVERETLRTWVPGAEADENTWMFGAVVDPTYMGMGVATVSVIRVSLASWSRRVASPDKFSAPLDQCSVGPVQCDKSG